MTKFGLAALALTLAATFGYLNFKLLKLPSTVGVLLIAFAASLIAALVDPVVGGVHLHKTAQDLVEALNLPAVLMDGALSILLFAGSLHIDADSLWRRKWTVLVLSTIGTVLAVALLGGGMWLVFRLTGQPIGLAWCCVLGAVIAPTDPVAVVGLLRRIGLPSSLQAIFAGESVFNDGVGIVLFTAILGAAQGGGGEIAWPSIVLEILVAGAGGGLIGSVIGYVALVMIRSVDEYNLELTISLALATGVYATANALHVSGPIAVVCAGLIVGSRSGREAMSDVTHHHLTIFWSLLDELLNLMLFMLIGLEVVAIPLTSPNMLAALIAVPLALATRAVSVFLPAATMHMRKPQKWASLGVLTWGGLRGGISVALALALPFGPERLPILTVTYAVVVFSVVVQGATMQRLASAMFPKDRSGQSEAP